MKCDARGPSQHRGGSRPARGGALGEPVELDRPIPVGWRSLRPARVRRASGGSNLPRPGRRQKTGIVGCIHARIPRIGQTQDRGRETHVPESGTSGASGGAGLADVRQVAPVRRAVARLAARVGKPGAQARADSAHPAGVGRPPDRGCRIPARRGRSGGVELADVRQLTTVQTATARLSAHAESAHRAGVAGGGPRDGVPLAETVGARTAI